MASSEGISKLVEDLKSKGIHYIRFELPDTHGTSRAKVIPIDKVEGFATKGLNLYGGTLALDTAAQLVGGSGHHEERKYQDMLLFPDLDSVQIIPWLPDTAKLICDCRWSPDDPIKAAPRYVLNTLLQKASEAGFEVMMGHEYEFYLLDPETHEPLFGGAHIFNSLRNQYVPFLDTLLHQLQAYGIDVITHNCEYSPSQFEINFGPTVGIAAADKAFNFKNAIKELAHRNGYLATFMSKPASDIAGSGCHVHLSLLEKGSGRPLFHDPGAPGEMPNILRYFTSGILEHAKGMAPLIGPTPNCYHRLKPGTFAPSNVSWGIDDRTAMVRLKDVGQENAHIEMRAPSGLANPYLAAAAVLAAGLLGIKDMTALPEESEGPAEENPRLPKLARSMEEALGALAADKAMREMLGEDFIKVFTTVKRHELARMRGHVSDWERNEYLELY